MNGKQFGDVPFEPMVEILFQSQPKVTTGFNEVSLPLQFIELSHHGRLGFFDGGHILGAKQPFGNSDMPLQVLQ